MIGSIAGNHGVSGEQSEFFSRGLGNQGSIERILMQWGQSEQDGNVFRPVKKWAQIERLEGLAEPQARVADVEHTLHRLDHHFPISDDTQEGGAFFNRLDDRSRKQLRSAQGDQRHAGVQEVAVQNSPERKRSTLTGSSHPG